HPQRPFRPNSQTWVAATSPAVRRCMDGALAECVGWTAPCMLQGRSVQPGKPVISMPIVNRVAELQPDIQAWRRDIHEHPELLYDVTCIAAMVVVHILYLGCNI